MASSTNKKVQVLRFDREPVFGFVNPGSLVADSRIEVLSVSGTLQQVPIGDVRWVSFVRDFDQSDLAADRRAFVARPKLDGLWVRMTFRDGEVLEGVVPNNLLLLEASGFTVVPPDVTQRIFVPRSALLGVVVLGVVGSPLKRAAKKAVPVQDQIGLFE